MLSERAPSRPGVPSRARRDLVGRYAGAMRDEGLRVGLYYSGGLDWHFNGRCPPHTHTLRTNRTSLVPPLVLSGHAASLTPYSGSRPFSARAQPHMGANWFGGVTGIPPGREYARYADAHWRELVARYDPDILWNDIGYPPPRTKWTRRVPHPVLIGHAASPPRTNRTCCVPHPVLIGHAASLTSDGYPSEGDIAGIAADFYNDNADGVINDRFRQGGPGNPVVQDFGTPEYASPPPPSRTKWTRRVLHPVLIGHAASLRYAMHKRTTPHKWEGCRGIGFSFGCLPPPPPSY